MITIQVSLDSCSLVLACAKKIVPSVDPVLRCDVLVRKGTSRKCAVSVPKQIVRSDHTMAELDKRVNKWMAPRRGRCLRAVLMVLDGHGREDVAPADGKTLQPVRDRVLQNGGAGVNGLVAAPRSGRPHRLTPDQDADVRTCVDAGPNPDPNGLVGRWLFDSGARFGINHGLGAVRKLLHAPGFRPLTPRPIHRKADAAPQAAFQEDFGAVVQDALPKGVRLGDVELWFQNGARLGQKGIRVRFWGGFRWPCLRPGQHRRDDPSPFRYLVGRGSDRHRAVVLDGADWHRPGPWSFRRMSRSCVTCQTVRR